MDTSTLRPAWAPLVYDGPVPSHAKAWEYAAGPTSYEVRFVYYFYRGTTLVYVGKAWNVHRRAEKHARRDWWPGVDRVLIERITGRNAANAEALALGRERQSISTLHPAANIARPRAVTA